MKQNVTRLCIILTCVFMLSSCTPVVEIFLFNNSGYPVKVKISDNNTICTIENGKGARLGYLNYQPIFIQTEKTNWVYCITNQIPLESCLTPSRWERHKLRVQLEATGEIYMLLPMDALPLKNFTNQPSGFPLQPTIQP